MKANVRSWKTTLIGIVGLSVLAGGLVMVYLKVISLTELGQTLGVIAIFLGSMASIFAKDSNVTGGTKQV